jgi:adenylosuccinate synthase
MKINSVDICVGLGDEAKGKITAHLSKTKDYDFVCRWVGENNAGHTIYVNNKKYITNLIPSGIFYNKKSIIGPDCVLHPRKFKMNS